METPSFWGVAIWLSSIREPNTAISLLHPFSTKVLSGSQRISCLGFPCETVSAVASLYMQRQFPSADQTHDPTSVAYLQYKLQEHISSLNWILQNSPSGEAVSMYFEAGCRCTSFCKFLVEAVSMYFKKLFRCTSGNLEAVSMYFKLLPPVVLDSFLEGNWGATSDAKGM